MQLKKFIENWIKKINTGGNKKIKARFVCALSICYLNKKLACVVGKVEGNISNLNQRKEWFWL